jgi:hypothetical protein
MGREGEALVSLGYWRNEYKATVFPKASPRQQQSKEEHQFFGMCHSIVARIENAIRVQSVCIILYLFSFHFVCSLGIIQY